MVGKLERLSATRSKRAGWYQSGPMTFESIDSTYRLGAKIEEYRKTSATTWLSTHRLICGVVLGTTCQRVVINTKAGHEGKLVPRLWQLRRALSECRQLPRRSSWPVMRFRRPVEQGLGVLPGQITPSVRRRGEDALIDGTDGDTVMAEERA